MVYLVRSARVVNNWGRAFEIANKLVLHTREHYSEVVESKLLSKISGDQDVILWVLVFNSLAEEEQFALKVLEDEVFMKIMEDSGEYFKDLKDDFFRELI